MCISLFLDILDMKKKSKYRIRKNELRKFEKENKLTKKEKERLHMWVDAGHSAYDLQWLYQLREEEPFFDYNGLDELDLDNLPNFEEEVDKKEEEPEIDLPF